jgi:hypothetical protein
MSEITYSSSTGNDSASEQVFEKGYRLKRDDISETCSQIAEPPGDCALARVIVLPVHSRIEESTLDSLDVISSCRCPNALHGILHLTVRAQQFYDDPPSTLQTPMLFICFESQRQLTEHLPVYQFYHNTLQWFFRTSCLGRHSLWLGS